ncbi:MAG: hypothetical protein AB8G11_02030 [Saprospiraceae bacterium]
MKQIFIIVSIILFTLSMYAQNKPIHTLDATLGYNHGYFKDLNYSPLNYTTNGGIINFDYQRRNIKKGHLLNVGLDFNANQISSDVATYYRANYLIANINLSYLKRVTSIKNNFLLYVGGQYHTNLNFVLFSGTEAFSFLFAHSLDLSIYGEFAIKNKHHINTRISLPVITQLVRPPHAGFDKEVIEKQSQPLRFVFDGSPTFVNNYTAFFWSNEYHYNLNTKWDFVAQYDLIYQSTPIVKQSKTLNNQIQFGVTYKF